MTRASVSKQRRGVAAIVWAAAIFGLAGCSTTTPTSHVTPTVTTTPAEFAGCAPSNLSVVAATDQDRYIAGAPVHIRITFRNHGGAPCSLRPGNCLDPSFEVRSRAGQVVWDSANAAPPGCFPPLHGVLLPVGQSLTTAATWAQMTGPGPPEREHRVSPGPYSIVGRSAELGIATAPTTVVIE